MKVFNVFLEKSVLIFCLGVLISALVFINISFTSNVIIIIALLILELIGIYILVKKNLFNKYIKFLDRFNITYIILLALILRIIWIILVPTEPASDFKLMYTYSNEVSQGHYYGFKDFNYFARFAHDIITVMYFSIFHKLFENPLIFIKIFNVIFQTSAVIFMYKLGREVFKDELTAKIAAFLLAIFPPFIMYTSQTMSENMAMPFYIASIYYFFKAINKKDKLSIIMASICGITLSIANMFRMVGPVIIIAYILYILVYDERRNLLKCVIPMLCSFMLMTYITSSILLYKNITEVHIWNSKEPSITSILKGTNMEHSGAYNKEDAELPIKLKHDKDAIKKEAKEIIENRFVNSSPSKITIFYITKLAKQWGQGDFGALGWTVKGDESIFAEIIKKYNRLFFPLICIIYVYIILRVIISLYKRQNINKEMYFFYILIGGFILLYLITEMQPRYAFISSWIFIILGSYSNSMEKIN
ncbi:ArnT family glycosyltransferase [Clostridium sp.]|uniref:ArnT family glycosyltransferase n=1 Tax=Clostridium sp. TaxID=1506 RepID=UPI003F3F332C